MGSLQGNCGTCRGRACGRARISTCWGGTAQPGQHRGMCAARTELILADALQPRSSCFLSPRVPATLQTPRQLPHSSSPSSRPPGEGWVENPSLHHFPLPSPQSFHSEMIKSCLSCRKHAALAREYLRCLVRAETGRSPFSVCAAVGSHPGSASSCS